MKPNFALTLSHEDIGLLHRANGGWVRVGGVAVDDPDLGAALSYLRRSALGLEPQGFGTKLVIPASEVLYTTVAAPGPGRARQRDQIATALEGATPYPVADLVFDWSGTGTEVQVAVVARETLAEAEAFARDHRFNPVCFVGIPPAGSFAGEPFFGVTQGTGKVERDQDPIALITRSAPVAPAATVEPPALPEPEAPVLATKEDTTAPTAAEPEPADAPLMLVDAPGPDAQDPAPTEPAPDQSLPGPEADPAPLPLPEVPADPAPTGADDSLGHLPTIPPEPATLDEETQAWPGEAEVQPPAPLVAEARGKPAKKPARKGKEPPAPKPAPLRSVDPATQVPAPKSEAEAMTRFGARRDTIAGKPRYLGLVLTGALLLVLAFVAIWASLFLDTPQQQGALAPPQLAEAPQDPAPTLPTEPAPTPAPQPEPEPLPAPEPPAPEPEPQPEPQPDPLPEPAPPLPRADAPAVAPASAVAQVIEDIRISRPDGVLAEVQALPRFSTASPLAPLPTHSPGLPPFDANLQFDASGALVPPAEGIVTPDGYRLIAARPEILPPPRPEGLVPAPAESPAPSEPPPDPAVVNEAAGADVLPTPELATAPGSLAGPLVTPAEAPLLFEPDLAGPVLRPRSRPEGLAPEPPPAPEVPAAAEPAAPDAVPAATEAAPAEDASLASPRPRARPAALAAAANRAFEAREAAQLAAAAAAAASAASTAALAAAPEADQNLVIASSRRPAARPQNFARAVEAAVAAAAAPPVQTTRRTPEPQADDDEEDEPEAQVTRAAPNIPTSANVASQATQKRALSLSQLALMGVFGTQNNRQALVREPGGRVVRVKVGDRLDGGRITAITASEVQYQKGNRVLAIAMPRG